MIPAGSRTRSREDSVKRRELEARRLPPLHVENEGGVHTYRVHRPTSGREVLSPLAPSEPQRSGTTQAPPNQFAHATPVPQAHTAASFEPPRARAVIEPIYPVLNDLPPLPPPAPPVQGTPPEHVQATGLARHDETDIIASRRWSPVGLRPTIAPGRRLARGWWFALALAVAFFVACVLLSF
jgi:hypothetical protein